MSCSIVVGRGQNRTEKFEFWAGAKEQLIKIYLIRQYLFCTHNEFVAGQSKGSLCKARQVGAPFLLLGNSELLGYFDPLPTTFYYHSKTTKTNFCLLNNFKRAVKSQGCVEMVKPWQLCRTVGPLPSQRLPLARAKVQPRRDLLYSSYQQEWQIYLDRY